MRCGKPVTGEKGCETRDAGEGFQHQGLQTTVCRGAGAGAGAPGEEEGVVQLRAVWGEWKLFYPHRASIACHPLQFFRGTLSPHQLTVRQRWRELPQCWRTCDRGSFTLSCFSTKAYSSSHRPWLSSGMPFR